MTEPLCGRCGAALHPGDEFCGNCGAPIAAAPPPPVVAPNPIEVAQMPTVPPPVGPEPGVTVAADQQRRPRIRLLAGIAAVLAVALIAGLGLALLSTRGDLDNERAKVAQVQAATTTTEASPDLGAIVPVVPAIDDQLAVLQKQLDQTNAALLKAQADLAAEKEGRAADTAAQTQAAADAVAAVQQQLTQLQSLFPVTPTAIASTNPTGAFTVALTAGECTLADCAPLTNLTIAFTDPSTIAGDRVNGAVTFVGGESTISGSLAPTVGPQCSGQPADPTYRLAVHVTSVDAADGALRAIGLQGTYTETISSGACAGQHRTFAVDLTRQ